MLELLYGSNIDNIVISALSAKVPLLSLLGSTDHLHFADELSRGNRIVMTAWRYRD
jgi:hypothetical protein